MITSEGLQASFRYLFVSELAALKQLAQSLPERNPRIINIGAGSGTSGLAFMESRPDIFLTTIDIQDEDSPFGCLEAERRVIDEAGYGNIPGMIKRHLQIHADSKVVGKEFQEAGFRKASLVFIDGDHSYNGCKGDILAWLPNIKPGGIMAVHDFNKKEVYKDGPIENAPHPLPWPGVDRAVRKFLCLRYEIILQVATLVAFRV